MKTEAQCLQGVVTLSSYMWRYHEYLWGFLSAGGCFIGR
jgi:hypothetical protein